MKTILSFDLSKKGNGWAVAANGELYASGSFQFKSLNQLYGRAKELIELYKPDAVVNCRGMGFSKASIRVLSALAAVIELLAERKEVIYFDVMDTTIRKHVFGNGHMKKEQVCQILKVKDNDEADAIAGALYLFRVK